MTKLNMAVAAVIVALGQHASAAIINSTFDTNLDGWTMVSSNGTLAWQSSGGNPGGYALFTDTSDGIGSIKAPPNFLGDLSGFNGGQLSFDYMVLDLGARIDRFLPIQVRIYSGSQNYTHTLATTAAGWDSLGWQTFSVPLTAGAFGAGETSWNQLLGNVTQLRINVESAVNLARPYDTDGVDNIAIATLGEPIPEPATVAVLAIGALGLLYRRRD